jgi:hypothetical protein
MAESWHRLDPASDGLHEAGADPWWREAWYFEFYDPGSELQFQAYQGVFPNAETGDLNAAVFHRGRRIHQVRKMDFHLEPGLPGERLGFGPMKLEPLEPMQRWRIRYDAESVAADLRFTAVQPPFSWAAARLWLESGAEPDMGSHHFDQLGRYEGTFWLEGEAVPVDTLGFRDRMWGWGGRRHWQSYLIMWAAFGEDCVANVALQYFDDGREALCGYLLADGETALLEHASADIEWHPHRWKTIANVSVRVEDTRGRQFAYTGRPLGILDTSHRWPHRNDHMLFSVGEYRAGDAVGHGVLNWAFSTEADQRQRFEARMEKGG